MQWPAKRGLACGASCLKVSDSQKSSTESACMASGYMNMAGQCASPASSMYGLCCPVGNIFQQCATGHPYGALLDSLMSAI